MRTTVDLPADTYRRVCELAERSGRSLSTTLADLTDRELSTLDEPVALGTDPRSGLPTLSLGRSITSRDVADLLDDE